MIKNRVITIRQLRTFGIALTIFLFIIGIINFINRNSQYKYFTGSAIIIFIISIFVPFIIKPVYRTALFFAHIIGWINARIFLTIIFYLLLTPIALILKILGKDPLDRKFDPQAESYWNIRTGNEPVKEQYLKQF